MRRQVRLAADVAAWALATTIVVLSVRWGRQLQREVPDILLGAAPLVGRNAHDGWDWRFGWSLVGAGALAVLAAASVWCGWWLRRSLSVVVAVSAAASAAFAVLLALTDGREGLTYGAAHDTEYLANLAIAPPAGEFVRSFVDRIDDYTVHQRGHPPGFVLLLKLFDGVGITGVWPVVVLTVVATGVLAAAVLVTIWAVAGGEWVRRVAPVLVVAPYLIWMVTSADAVFTATAATGIALLAVGIQRCGPAAVACGAGAGACLGALLFLTYGGAMFVAVPLAVVSLRLWRRDRPPTTGAAVRTVAAASVAAAAVVAAFAAAGFWWVDGALATRREYWAGTAQFRTFGYFAVGNIGAAVLAMGPLTIGGLLRLRSRPLWALVAGGAVALLASHLSRYTLGEVERIWLLFFPWIAVAGGALIAGRRVGTAWIAVQATSAIALQAALVSKW